MPEGLSQQLEVASICMNCTGTLVAAVANRVQHQVADGANSSSSSTRDSRLFVYCSETNSCMLHDFGKEGKAPYICSWDTQDPRLLAVQVQVGTTCYDVVREALSCFPSKTTHAVWSSHVRGLDSLFIGLEHSLALLLYDIVCSACVSNE